MRGGPGVIPHQPGVRPGKGILATAMPNPKKRIRVMVLIDDQLVVDVDRVPLSFNVETWNGTMDISDFRAVTYVKSGEHSVHVDWREPPDFASAFDS